MSDKRQLTGLFFGGWGDYQVWADHDFRLKDPADEPSSEAMTAPVTESEPVYVTPPARQPAVEIIEESEPRPLVRPYTRTGGRTRPAHTLELETLLSYSPAWRVDLAML